MWSVQKICFVIILVSSCATSEVRSQYASQYAHHCYMLSCLGCNAHAASRRGDSVECHPNNWVSPVWLHNLGHPAPTTSSIFPVEYRCLKMIATPDDPTHGHTADVIRGCVPAVQVDSVCTGLVAVERARGHSNARCFVCRGDSCNGSRARIDKMAAKLVIAALVACFAFR